MSLQGQNLQGQQAGPYNATNLAGPSQQSNLGTNYPSNLSGNSQTPPNQNYPTSSTEQYAQEALIRGVDPLNTQQNVMYNASQSTGLGPQSSNSQGYADQKYGAQGVRNQDSQGLQNPPLGQNLTQTPYFSGTDPLIYEGDVNRYNRPPLQKASGHGNQTTQDPVNPQQRNI